METALLDIQKMDLGSVRMQRIKEATKLIEEGEREVRSGWLNQARGYSIIVKEELYKDFGFNSAQDYITENLKRDGKAALTMVRAYEAFGDKVPSDLPYRRVRELYHLPEEAAQKIVNDPETVAKLPAMSDVEFQEVIASNKEVKTAKKSADRKSITEEKKPKNLTARQEKDKKQKKEQQNFNKAVDHSISASLREEKWKTDIKSHSTQILTDINALLAIRKQMGQVQFETELEHDPELIKKIDDLTHLMLSPVQHAEMGAFHIKNMVERVIDTVKCQGPADMDFSQYEEHLLVCRQALSSYEKFLRRTTNVASIDAQKMGKI